MRTAPATATEPLWLPEGIDFDSLGEGLQRDVIDIINPLYEQRVLGVRDALAKLQGYTLVETAFWQLHSQWVLGHSLAAACQSSDGDDRFCQRRTQHMRIVNTQQRVANSLFNQDKFHARTKPPGESAHATGMDIREDSAKKGNDAVPPETRVREAAANSPGSKPEIFRQARSGTIEMVEFDDDGVMTVHPWNDHARRRAANRPRARPDLSVKHNASEGNDLVPVKENKIEDNDISPEQAQAWRDRWRVLEERERSRPEIPVKENKIEDNDISEESRERCARQAERLLERERELDRCEEEDRRKSAMKHNVAEDNDLVIPENWKK